MIYKCKPARVRLYHNTAGKTAATIRAEMQCDYVFNASLFNMTTKRIYCPTKIDGAWYGRDGYNYYGFGWGEGELPRRMTSKEAESDSVKYFVSCLWAVTDGKAEALQYNADMGGNRQRTAFGMTKDGKMVIYCNACTPLCTPEGARAVLLAQGCDTGIVLDGGGSSQCSAAGNSVTSARVVPVLVCVWADHSATEKTEEKAVKTTRKYKVAIDPGHGNAELNQSPDGRYFEKHMAWLLAQKQKELLESTGRFEVLIVKNSEDETPSLSERARRANEWGADIYLSDHSNAVGAGKWVNGTHGLTAWIYAAGGSREKLARAILEQMEVLGVELFGSKLYTSRFTVLAKTDMPAVLVEHYFHTCEADVNKLLDDDELETLAYADCRGICEYFCIGADTLTPEEEEKEIEVKDDIFVCVAWQAFDDENDAQTMAAALEKQGLNVAVSKK